MSFSDWDSLTTNLSFGERPVCGEVTATNGPIAANSPSLRRAAAFISSGPTRFQLTRPEGRRPCLERPMLLSRDTLERSGFVSVAISIPQFSDCQIWCSLLTRTDGAAARLRVHHR